MIKIKSNKGKEILIDDIDSDLCKWSYAKILYGEFANVNFWYE